MATTQTISSGQSAGEFPASLTGSLFRFALVRGETTTFSDSTSDLVGAIIPGYELSTGDDEALIARWQCAAATATQVQQLMAAAAGLDPGAEDEPTLTAIFTDRASPLPAGSLTGGAWDHEVPLVLLATDYQPFTGAPAPRGNALFIDSSTERAFLRTLSVLGVCEFYARDAS
jgi:hypothetical protein